MPIQTGDIKLLQSEVLLDTDNGGGRMTANEVVDGLSNNLFPDISELDRTYGRIALRKAFPAVMTSTTDAYFGCNLVVAKAPDDPNVSMTMFTTRNWFDHRSDAANGVQSYLAKSVKWAGQLLGTQLQGQRSVQLLLKVGDPVPKIGQTLVLVQFEGLPTEFSQYVRVSDVKTTTRQFNYNNGTAGGITFTGVMATLTISSQLLYTFNGPEPTPYDNGAAQAICRDTVVANAANYYGVSDLIEAVAPGDVNIGVKSIYSQLVPSAQQSTPLANLNAAGNYNPAVQSGQTRQAIPVIISGAYPQLIYVPTAIKPGSLTLGACSDDGAGNLIITSNNVVVGTVAYTTNTITLSQSMGQTGQVSLSWMPAGVPVMVANTASIDINQTNRQNVFVQTLAPFPAPRRLQISYMAQGNWYTLTDTGGSGGFGAIKGSDPSLGAGTINYATGTVTLTLGALPDDGSSLMFAWSSPVQYFNRSDTTPPAPWVSFFIAPTDSTQQLVMGTVNVTWPKPGGGNYSATVVSDTQKITGDATGYIRWYNGQYEIRLSPNVLPAGGTTFTLNYNLGSKKTKHFTAPLRDGNADLNLVLDDKNIVPSSLKVTWNVLINDYSTISNVPAQMQYFQTDPYATAQGDSTGKLRQYKADGTNTVVDHSAVDYVNGLVKFKPDVIVSVPQPVYQSNVTGYMRNANGGLSGPDFFNPVYQNTLVGINYYPVAATYPNDASGSVDVEYMTNTGSAQQQQVTVSEWKFDLTYQYNEPLVPGSVMFAWGGKVYYELNGTLFCDFNAGTNSGTAAGTINYATGEVSITTYTPGGGNGVSLLSLLTTVTGQPVDFLSFRVPQAPVVPGSLQLQFSPVTGGTVTATSNPDGTITGTNCFGYINYQTGVVNMRFGRMVTAAGNESAIWYNPDAVTTDGKIFKPYPIFANTATYNAVAYSYLPLDSSILGLDPVRLPVDGRVPIFQKGYVVVVHHTEQIPFPNANAGTKVSATRVRLAVGRVIDSSVPYKVVDPSMYSTDLNAGTCTLGGSINTSGYKLPLVFENRIEDMAQTSDVQINGRLALTRQLTHNFPVPGSKVSSALIAGDLQAQALNMFAQATWSGAWSNALIGAAPTANYNNAQYPILVTNKGALQERWALMFTDPQNFRVVGEQSGQVATGNVNQDCAPNNPATNQPYFTLRAAGWGGGWQAGNILRFNTTAANFPVWVARTVLQGPATVQDDTFQIQIRGDIDRQ
ncbi:hypothetical protein [Ralstonia sp. ASV6]|uniref:hypothetical protein n=1 Tax=Ralstonia sp. ASV6 TaxID=2795124 RepID=UPI0018EB482E|nr:hypothetical protein [Ralstonia sp. ASV6]